MDKRGFQFEWDDAKVALNAQKHSISFELACTVFNDPRLLTVADLEHSEIEDRWFSIGSASNGTLVSVVYLWSEDDPPITKIRIISARKATPLEMCHYQDSL